MRNVLIQAQLDKSPVPEPFQSIQAVNLNQWSNEENHPQFVNLVRSIRLQHKKKTYTKLRRSIFFLGLPIVASLLLSYFWISGTNDDNSGLYKKIDQLESDLNIEAEARKSLLSNLESAKDKIINLENKQKKIQQYVFRIDDVEFNKQTKKRPVRIVVQLNDYSFSFPSKTIWLGSRTFIEKINGYSFSSENPYRKYGSEEFILPANLEEYRIKFSGYILGESDIPQPLFGGVRSVKSTDFPVDDQYELKVKSLKDPNKKIEYLHIKYSIVPILADDVLPREIVKKILSSIGLKRNFKILAADMDSTSSLAAVIKNGERFLLYNRKYIAKLQTDKWGQTLVFAHEIAHHLNGHIMGNNADYHNNELEADEFAGYVLARLGATLEETKAPIEKLITKVSGSVTHPPKSERLAAVVKGWKSVNTQ